MGALLHPDSVLTVTPFLGFLQSQIEDSGEIREGGPPKGAGNRGLGKASGAETDQAPSKL